ncbi:hypothetical protein BRADI_4g05976v3 [Brachypodium distachyon]|uniref:F-box domain-containing protein n=1 Tax=Brachypodium distachyon TaxID=15368 RepID=A0A0Q3HE38_BRADI|nr:hypothetical protein BRADI_4g05976v3 [Brachypodium distachyon]
MENQAVESLPKEMLMEILARLPAKSCVGRFRCVSREWSAMLSSEHFVDLHARRANRPDRPRLLLAPVVSSYDDCVYSWQPGGQVEKLMSDDFAVTGLLAPVTKPCHGLILIRCTDHDGYFVCNPSTGDEVLPLPDSEVPLKTISRPSIRGQPEAPSFYGVAYGLGYCSVTKQHKVVRLFWGNEVSSCEVLVLDTPAYWRPTAQNPPLSYVTEEKPAVFLRGQLHFLCRDGDIATFNTSSETFGSLLPPTGFEDASPLLTELDDCLCFCYGEPDSDDPYRIFLLRDYTEGRWEKLCCIDRIAWPESERMLLRSLHIAPLVMYHSDDGQRRIMFGTGACKVFAVGLDSNIPEILFTPDGTIIGSCEDDSTLPLCLFEEYLSSAGRTIEEMAFSSPTTKAWSEILKWMPARSVSELSLVCREYPRVMVVIDAVYGHYMNLKDFFDAGAPALHRELVCAPQPCHGLNVGSSGPSDFIYNPVMGYCEHIGSVDDDEPFFAGRIGLGYHSEINKHVVKNLNTRDYELQCKLRYVKEQQWRSVDPPPRPIADTPPTYVNGKIYWIVEPNLGTFFLTCEIVAFNVETEEFEVLQGPPCSHDNGRISILQLQGALCIACSDKSQNVLDIWMMMDIDTWLMRYHIELKDFLPHYLSENTTPLVVDPKDGRVLLNTGLSLGYYDPKMAALETIYSVGL